MIILNAFYDKMPDEVVYALAKKAGVAATKQGSRYAAQQALAATISANLIAQIAMSAGLKTLAKLTVGFTLSLVLAQGMLENASERLKVSNPKIYNELRGRNLFSTRSRKCSTPRSKLTELLTIFLNSLASRHMMLWIRRLFSYVFDTIYTVIGGIAALVAWHYTSSLELVSPGVPSGLLGLGAAILVMVVLAAIYIGVAKLFADRSDEDNS